MKLFISAMLAKLSVMLISCSVQDELHIARQQKSIDVLNETREALLAYRLEESHDASDLSILIPKYLTVPPKNKIGLPVDGWGNPIRYCTDLRQLSSTGADGQFETRDDIVIYLKGK